MDIVSSTSSLNRNSSIKIFQQANHSKAPGGIREPGIPQAHPASSSPGPKQHTPSRSMNTPRPDDIKIKSQPRQKGPTPKSHSHHDGPTEVIAEQHPEQPRGGAGLRLSMTMPRVRQPHPQVTVRGPRHQGGVGCVDGSFIMVCSHDGTHTRAHTYIHTCSQAGRPARQSSRGRSWWPGWWC